MLSASAVWQREHETWRIRPPGCSQTSANSGDTIRAGGLGQADLFVDSSGVVIRRWAARAYCLRQRGHAGVARFQGLRGASVDRPQHRHTETVLL
jgi:hypothetical protein